MGGACSQKLKSRRGLPSSSGRFCIGWDAATLTQDPIGQQKPASPGLQLVGEIHYCWGGSFLPSAQGQYNCVVDSTQEERIHGQNTEQESPSSFTSQYPLNTLA